MGQFVLSTYQGDKQVSEETDSSRDAWSKYFEKAIDVAPGIQASEGVKTVTTSGDVVDGKLVDDNNLVGVQVFEASDLEGALDIARTCPILDEGGSVVVHQLVQEA
mgnify:CR=1